MPKLGGPELVERLRKARPSLNAVYMSGYAQRFGPGGELPAGAVLLQKPFSQQELTAKIAFSSKTEGIVRSTCSKFRRDR